MTAAATDASNGPAKRRATHSGERPVLIAHRGASGYRPEHTLAAYALAIDMGADFIEPDLVMSKDGVLVIRHENALAMLDPASGAIIEATTNVHAIAHFAARCTTKVIDGHAVTGWFSEDFTLAELRTLRARERIPKERPANAAYDDQYAIPTLQDAIDLANSKGAALGRTIGIYPETKHPSYHASIGLPMEDVLVKTLEANGLNGAAAPVCIQSFETANLRYLDTISTVKLVQLLHSKGRPWDFIVSGDGRSYVELANAEGLREIAGYAHVVAPEKSHIITPREGGTLDAPSSFVREAHAAGLRVHPWTFRAENAFLPMAHRRGVDRSDLGDGEGEIIAFLREGVDGFFTDHPDIGANALRRFANDI